MPNDPERGTFENTVGKGENAENHHFLLFPHVSYPSIKEFQFFKLCIQYNLYSETTQEK